MTATHDLESAMRFADRLWLLGDREAFEEGSPAALSASGSINRFFDRDNVYFDREKVRFELKGNNEKTGKDDA